MTIGGGGNTSTTPRAFFFYVMNIYHRDWIKNIKRFALRISSMRGLNKVLAGTFIPFTVISLEKITIIYYHTLSLYIL
jgi:hypothetical protein